MLINLTKEFSQNTSRIYSLEVDENTVYIEYGFSSQEEMQTFKTEFEAGKAGRTAEEEAIVLAYKKVAEKIANGFEDSDGNFDELEQAYEEVFENVQARKDEAKAEKEAEKERVKAEKAEAKAKEKAEKEAEKARVKAEKDAEKARIKAEKEAEKAVA